MDEKEKFLLEYLDCVYDLLENEKVLNMNLYIQHANVSCLRHCFHVSILSYYICKKLGFNARVAARGGLLHDMFLYDWHENDLFSWHGFRHPAIALKNANEHVGELSEHESDIILNHMWPLTLYRIPRFKETYVVTCADKICTILEVIKFRRIAIFLLADKLIYKKVIQC